MPPKFTFFVGLPLFAGAVVVRNPLFASAVVVRYALFAGALVIRLPLFAGAIVFDANLLEKLLLTVLHLVSDAEVSDTSGQNRETASEHSCPRLRKPR
ncbi:hypothetical protein AXA44_02685 [Rhodococcus sp. SC4]|nr:hypothetical protein AXA44_02685 [Rhodococcus sp. SC4]